MNPRILERCGMFLFLRCRRVDIIYKRSNAGQQDAPRYRRRSCFNAARRDRATSIYKPRTGISARRNYKSSILSAERLSGEGAPRGTTPESTTTNVESKIYSGAPGRSWPDPVKHIHQAPFKSQLPIDTADKRRVEVHK